MNFTMQLTSMLVTNQIFRSLKKPPVLAHIRSRHSHDPNFLVICGRPGCSKTYKLFSSFESHFSRNHPELIKETDEGKENEIISHDDSDDPEHSPSSEGESDSENDTRDTSSNVFEKLIYSYLN